MSSFCKFKKSFFLRDKIILMIMWLYIALYYIRAQSLTLSHLSLPISLQTTALTPLLHMENHDLREVVRGRPSTRTQILCFPICCSFHAFSLPITRHKYTSQVFQFFVFVISARYVFSSDLWTIEILHNSWSHNNWLWGVYSVTDHPRKKIRWISEGKLCFNNQKWPYFNTLWEQSSLRTFL